MRRNHSTLLNYSNTAWERSDGLIVRGESTQQSDTQVAVGVGVQGVVRHGLTRNGRAAHAGYKWLCDIAVGGSSSSANVDLSDWEVGVGVGIRFGVKALLPEIRDLSMAQQRAKPGPKSQHWLDRLLWRTHSISVRLGR
jgi:hypothetical protein